MSMIIGVGKNEIKVKGAEKTAPETLTIKNSITLDGEKVFEETKKIEKEVVIEEDDDDVITAPKKKGRPKKEV